MSLSIKVKGVELSQAQLDAIIPIINEGLVKPPRNIKEFEQKCIKAMSNAGCPLVRPKS